MPIWLLLRICAWGISWKKSCRGLAYEIRIIFLRFTRSLSLPFTNVGNMTVHDHGLGHIWFRGCWEVRVLGLVFIWSFSSLGSPVVFRLPNRLLCGVEATLNRHRMLSSYAEGLLLDFKLHLFRGLSWKLRWCIFRRSFVWYSITSSNNVFASAVWRLNTFLFAYSRLIK
jgi:hypothetical protein